MESALTKLFPDHVGVFKNMLGGKDFVILVRGPSRPLAIEGRDFGSRIRRGQERWPFWARFCLATRASACTPRRCRRSCIPDRWPIARPRETRGHRNRDPLTDCQTRTAEFPVFHAPRAAEKS